VWSLVLLPLEECRLKILLFQSIPNRPYLYPGSLSAEGGVNIFSNQVFLNAVPKTKPWVLIFLISLLVGIVACGKIFNALTPVLEAAFTFTGSTGMAEASSIKVGALIFAKNALVAFLCLITARLTLGIYPFISPPPLYSLHFAGFFYFQGGTGLLEKYFRPLVAHFRRSKVEIIYISLMFG